MRLLSGPTGDTEFELIHAALLALAGLLAEPRALAAAVEATIKFYVPDLTMLFHL